ncbi:MAG: hypothetical protein WEA61_07815 [Anaerolineales bacterium]
MPKTTIIPNDALLNAEMDIYYDFLDSLVSFLKDEVSKHDKDLESIQAKFDSGELKYPDDTHEMPGESQYDYWRKERLERFEHILLNSFFVSIYSLLESTLNSHCRELEGPNNVKLEDIHGKGVPRATKYLTKVHGVKYDVSDKNPDWTTVEYYGKLRNSIAHNEGIVKEKELLEFISSTDGLSMESVYVRVQSDFCRTALDRITSFLIAVLFTSEV